MTDRLARTHWLRGNAGERTPSRLIILDAESRTAETEPRELHVLRCWVARVIVRDPETSGVLSCVQSEGLARDQITALVTATVKAKAPWRLFTHNLSYDLGLTRLPLDLLADGWQLGRHNLASQAPWAYLKKGGRGLWLCDSWSWLPTPVEKLGEALGIAKLKLPDQDDSDEAWLARCRRDVEIQSVALLDLMAEWDRRNLGHWSITGPASGWNTMLHFPARGRNPKKGPAVRKSEQDHPQKVGERVLIQPDPVARAFERTALYSGRRDVWKVGNLREGPYAEVDLKQAHLSICANLPLPYRRWAPFDALALDDWRLDNDRAGTIAEVLLNVDQPRYPCRLGGAVLHPVGQFATTLAGPEILEARRRGELVSIGKGYGYHLGHVMRDWATWALGIVNSQDGEVSPMLRMAVRDWGRSVPGRWGMTHSRQVKEGESVVEGWKLERITLGNPPRRGFIFHAGGRWQESLADQEADDSFPAVLAYVQSYCRLALNAMLDAIPAGDLVSCNTEGAWVNQAGLIDVAIQADRERPLTPTSPGWPQPYNEALSRVTAPLECRIKQTTQHLKVLSPQHHQTDQARLYSGIPRAADEVRKDEFAFWTWPKLKGQIEKGDPRGYVRERRKVNLAGLPVSRWSYQDGWCQPVLVAWSPEDGNVIQRPDPELERRHGPLRPLQHPVLRKVLEKAGGAGPMAGLDAATADRDDPRPTYPTV